MPHHHHHGHDHNNHDVKNIKVAFFLNLGFTIIEFIGGFYVNSVAIISDAIHDLGDCLSLGISWYFQKISHKGRTATFSYGYKRFSVLSAILNSVVLLVGSLFILLETIPRLIEPEQPDAKGMIVLAILGVIVNGAAVLKTRKGKTVNERVVSLHLLEDVLGWVAVLIGSIVMSLTYVPILDPLLSLLIAGYILFNVFRNLKQSLKIILQSIPPDVDTKHLEDGLLSIKHVAKVHDMHTWTMDGDYHVMTLHLVLDEDVDLDTGSEIKTQAREIIKAGEIDHVTIELESPNEHCELKEC